MKSKGSETMTAAGGKVPSWFLLATIFITGSVIMMVELVGTRVVGPYFGVGIYVWSALITVTMLALAAGYWLGGIWADKNRTPEVLFQVILGAALCTWIIPIVRYPVLTFAGNFGMRTGVLVGSAILFGPGLFLLGMVSPYATKLFTDQMEKLGSRVGLLYSISTLGSFLGTVTMGFWLIPNFHITTILVGLGAMLALTPLLYFFLLRTPRRPSVATLALFGVGVLLLVVQHSFAPPAMSAGTLIYKDTSFYGEIKVVDFGQERLLLVDGVTQSGADKNSFQGTPPYVKDMNTLLTRHHPAAHKALVVGLGGGNIVHALLAKNMEVQIVDIDPKIINVAERFFGVDPRRVTITMDDGRHFVRTTPAQYDVVVLNTFNGETFPSHLLTKEFFQEVKRILKPNGVVALNFVGYVQGPHREASAAVYATFRSTFKWCESYFHDVGYKFNNINFIAGDGEMPPEPSNNADWAALRGYAVVISDWEKAVVCSDDYNPVEFLNRTTYRRWRQLVIESLGPEILLN